jgi:hypothetical protein
MANKFECPACKKQFKAVGGSCPDCADRENKFVLIVEVAGQALVPERLPEFDESERDLNVEQIVSAAALAEFESLSDYEKIELCRWGTAFTTWENKGDDFCAALKHRANVWRNARMMEAERTEKSK